MTPEDRGTLGALLDGELSGDARRFALRRLSHDTVWQQAAARWQLAGDVLRGEPVLAAPAGFAARVAAAVAAEQAAAMPVRAPAPVQRSGRRHARWIGGAALAASVAMVTLFAVRSPLQPVVDGEPGLADARGLRLEPAPAVAPVEAAPVDPAPAMSALAAAAPLAVAAADASRRETARPRGQQQRAALRAAQAREGQAAAPIALAAAAPEPALEPERDDTRVADSVETAPLLQEPFAPTGAIVSRPWPRATPALSGRNAFTASFEAGTHTAAPTFYPFEPHLAPELREQFGVALPPAAEPVPQH